MPESLFLCLLLLFLTLASGYFSGSETALFSLSQMKVKAYRKDPDPKNRLIYKLLSQPKDLLVTVFMLNTLVNILLQNIASKMFGMQAGWGLKVGVPLFLTLIIGEIIPKNIGMQNNVAIAHFVVPSINFFHEWLSRVRKITVAITHPVSRLLFFYLKKEQSISQEELQHVLETSEKHGVLHADEATLVQGYLKLHNATVKEIMVPKEDVLFYDINEPITKLTHLFTEQECTRIPVCKDGLNNVIGIITAKHYFLQVSKIDNVNDIKKLLTKPFYVPETTLAYLLLRQFDESGQVISIVVDEYGSVSGLVTREDIAELVVGDITDRRDQASLYSEAGKDVIIATGKLELTEFNRIFDASLKSPSNMVTLGGFLIEELGEIPKAGTTYQTDNFLFKILAADPNRIGRVYIRKLQELPKDNI